MNAPRDSDVDLASWLDDGPTDLPSSTRRAILTAVRTSPQARAGLFGPPVWRPTMSRFFASAGAAAVFAVAIGGAALLLAGNTGGAPGEAPRSTTTPTVPGGVSLDWTTWQDFNSTRYGYRARFPARWTATPATRYWQLQRDHGDQHGPASDTFIDETPGAESTPLTAFSVAVGSHATLDDWINAYLGPGYNPDICSVIERTPFVIDGHHGELTGTSCGDSEGFVLADGRMYVFSDWGSGQRDLLQAFLATVHIDGIPDTAPTPSPDALDTSWWNPYDSAEYGFTIAHPADWTETPANRAWTFAADAEDPLSPATDVFSTPVDGGVRVSAWTLKTDPGTTIESWDALEAWVQGYCEKTNNTPCTGIADRAVPMCLERRDCHPAVIVPFENDVQAFFIGGGRDMTVVAVWRPEADPSVARFGGARQLLEAFLSTTDVFLPNSPDNHP